jgi:AraC-like DNA-binding protein
VAEYECDPGEVERGQRHIASSDSDDILLGLPLSGCTIIRQDDRQSVIDSGTFAILDPRRPFAGSITSPLLKSLIVQVPRRALESRLGDIAALTARRMDPRQPVVGLASAFLTMLAGKFDAVDGPAASRIAEQALDLVALAYAVETDQHDADLFSPRATALLRLKSAIEARLHDPELKPAAAAALAGMGVRYANVLLSAEGTSLERYIFTRRLERCRRALDDPSQEHRTIGDIAFRWGFSDVSHFGRCFKAAFGASPGEYRRRSR